MLRDGRYLSLVNEVILVDMKNVPINNAVVIVAAC